LKILLLLIYFTYTLIKNKNLDRISKEKKEIYMMNNIIMFKHYKKCINNKNIIF
jgi:hypothetical protein